jgi:hypothetical protein
MMRVVEITVSPTGQTSVQTKGFLGPSCREASRLIERALGKCERETLTSEFHETAHEQAAHDQRL